MIARQIAALPDFLAGRRVDRGRAMRAEVNVNTTSFDRGRWRGVAVLGMNKLRLGDIPQLEIVLDAAGFEIDANGIIFRAISWRSREPDLISPHDRTAPPA